MFKRVITGIFGTRHDRERRKIQPIVDEINEHYERLHGVSEEELPPKPRSSARSSPSGRATSSGASRN